MHASPRGALAKHGRPNSDLQLLPPGRRSSQELEEHACGFQMCSSSDPSRASSEKIRRRGTQSCAPPFLQKDVAESRSRSNSIKKAVKDDKFGRSLPLNMRNDPRKFQKNSVMWKSVFLLEITPKFHCRLPCRHHGCGVFFRLNQKLLSSLQSCVSSLCPPLHLPPAPSQPTVTVWCCLPRCFVSSHKKTEDLRHGLLS